MAPSDDWRPYTIPYSSGGAVKRSGTWVPSSKAHTTPLVLAPQQPPSSAETGLAPSPAMDTSATAANDPDRTYTAAGFRSGPDIPSLPVQSPFVQTGHPRFAADRGLGEGIPCEGGNPPAGCFGKAGYSGGENAQNGEVKSKK